MSTNRNFVRNATRIVALFGAAASAASAAESGRRPHNRTLETLGIDPDQYRQIGR
jgi:hypothetical protein